MASRFWLIAGVLLSPPLGVVGAAIGLPGPAGAVAALVVPAGAVLQMAVLPPRTAGLMSSNRPSPYCTSSAASLCAGNDNSTSTTASSASPAA